MAVFNNFFVKNDEGKVFLQFFASFTAILATTTCGLHYGWPSPSLPKLLHKDSEIPITENQGFWIATMPLISEALGATSAIPLVDTIGRRKTIILVSIPYLTSWIIIAFAWNVELLYAARFIAGLADGWSFIAVPMYIGEIAQPKVRGLLASGISVSVVFGILLINIIGSYMSIKRSALLVFILPVMLLVTFFWMPESPYYLIMKNKNEEAKGTLTLLIGPRSAESELMRISKAVKEDLSREKSSILDLFTVKSNRKAVIIMMIARGSGLFSGFAATVLYAQNIFEEAGGNLSPQLASIIYFSIQLVVTVFSAGLVDRWGRRPLLLLSIIGSSVALLVEGLYFYFESLGAIDSDDFGVIAIVSLIFFVIFYSIGLQNIPILTLSEIFGQDIKSKALCFSDLYFSLVATGVSKFFQATRDTYGMYFPFLCFSCFCALSTVLIYVMVPETKGKTLEEIQEHLRGDQHSTNNNKINKV